ncbi:alpha/beta hydrolase family protein [Streptomyces sp. NPDC047928]|uniref:alpha/beta hydrolase family protein n=1 Tax=unclassified Streptomyces TaxID=2593676 RepID=UPI0037228861
MTSSLDLPGALGRFTALNRSRAAGAGLDLFAYDRVTAALGSLYDWPEAFRAEGRARLAAADAYAADGNRVSAGDACRHAARWFHCATLLPHPDGDLLARAAAEADGAMRRALALLEPDAVRVEGAGFAGWLRRPEQTARGARRPGVVVVVPGLDSGKEEFHGVAEELLRRGVAVLAMDGPGQGVLAGAEPPTPDYPRVLGEAIDALEGDAGTGLDTTRLALIGMSLGGYYAAMGAAYDSRVRAAATVSGPYRLIWEELPQFVVETLTERAGSVAEAEKFVRRIDLRGVAERIACPLRVVDGGQDVIPGVVGGAALARAVPHGTRQLVPHGDHLLGNARADWLPATADWLAARVA